MSLRSRPASFGKVPLPTQWPWGPPSSQAGDTPQGPTLLGSQSQKEQEMQGVLRSRQVTWACVAGLPVACGVLEGTLGKYEIYGISFHVGVQREEGKEMECFGKFPRMTHDEW